MMREGIWEVQYRDGRILNQFDQNAPEFHRVKENPLGGEVPLRKIDWNQVHQFTFYNMETGVGQTFNYIRPPEGYQTKLVCRTFGTPDFKDSLRGFLVVVSKDDVVEHVFYWFPDFTTHSCHDFECAEVRDWALKQLHHLPGSLVESHNILPVAMDIQVA